MEASWTMVMVIGKGNCERMVLPSTPLLEDTTYQQTQTKMILSPSFISFLVMKLILLAVDAPLLGTGSVCWCHIIFHIQDMTSPRTKNLLPLGCHLFVAQRSSGRLVDTSVLAGMSAWWVASAAPPAFGLF